MLNKKILILIFGLLAAAPSGHAQFLEPHEKENIVFRKTHLIVGKRKISVEIADDEVRREHGLMFRKSLPAESGMLFIFEEERPVSFWMKNTLIPLSIGYFDAHHVLKKVLEMNPAVSGDERPPTYPSE